MMTVVPLKTIKMKLAAAVSVAVGDGGNSNISSWR